MKSSLFPYAVFASRNAAGHGRGESLILDFVVAAVAVFNPSVFLTPSPYGHSPYMAVPHRGRGSKSSLSPYAVFAPRNAAGHGKGGV